jgi:hypothetical protein
MYVVSTNFFQVLKIQNHLTFPIIVTKQLPTHIHNVFLCHCFTWCALCGFIYFLMYCLHPFIIRRNSNRRPLGFESSSLTTRLPIYFQPDSIQNETKLKFFLFAKTYITLSTIVFTNVFSNFLSCHCL